MKLIIILSLALFFAPLASAAGDGPSENIRGLSEKICTSYSMAASKIAINSKNVIQRHMRKYENIANPTTEQIIKFLNHNKHYMTCGEKRQNYMMYAFEQGNSYNQLFNVLFYDMLLVDDESLFVDVNAISYSGPPDGKTPETVLDYMYRESEDSSNSKPKRFEIKELIVFFEGDLGARRYVDLPNEDKEH